jgi:hypothetical protein
VLLIVLFVAFSMSSYFALIGIGAETAKKAAIAHVFRSATHRQSRLMEQREKEARLLPELTFATQFYYGIYRSERRYGTLSGRRGGGRVATTLNQSYRAYRRTYQMLRSHQRKNRRQYERTKATIRQIRTLYHDRSFTARQKAQQATPLIVRLNRLLRQLSHSGLPAVQSALESSHHLSLLLRIDDKEVSLVRNRRRRRFLMRQQLAQAKFRRAHEQIQTRLRSKISDLTQHRRVHIRDYELPSDLMGVFIYINEVWPLACVAFVIDFLMPLLSLWLLTHLSQRQRNDDQNRLAAEAQDPRKRRSIPTIPTIKPTLKTNDTDDKQEKNDAKPDSQDQIFSESDGLPRWIHRANARKAHQTRADSAGETDLHQ